VRIAATARKTNARGEESPDEPELGAEVGLVEPVAELVEDAPTGFCQS